MYCVSLLDQKHSRCWACRAEREEAWASGLWKLHSQAKSPVFLPDMGSHSSAADWSCTVWVLPGQAHRHSDASEDSVQRKRAVCHW